MPLDINQLWAYWCEWLIQLPKVEADAIRHLFPPEQIVFEYRPEGPPCKLHSVGQTEDPGYSRIVCKIADEHTGHMVFGVDPSTLSVLHVDEWEPKTWPFPASSSESSDSSLQ